MPNPIGRPPLYTSAEELEPIVEEYFDHCDNRIQHVYSKKRDEVVEIINPEPYTMAGLAYHIGMDRRTLLDYGKKEEFYPTIKKARDRVHMDVERRLMDGAGAGAIFSLKNNFDWKDVSSRELTGKDGGAVEANTSVTYYPKGLPENYWEKGTPPTNLSDDA